MNNYDEHLLDVGHLKDVVEERFVKSGIVNILGHLMLFLIALITGMILARLISPASFGLFAIVEVLIAFTETFRSLGLREAVTQKDAINHQQLSTLFWFNIRLNFVILGCVLIAAPIISVIYSESLLCGISLNSCDKINSSALITPRLTGILGAL